MPRARQAAKRIREEEGKRGCEAKRRANPAGSGSAPCHHFTTQLFPLGLWALGEGDRDRHVGCWSVGRPCTDCLCLISDFLDAFSRHAHKESRQMGVFEGVQRKSYTSHRETLGTKTQWEKLARQRELVARWAARATAAPPAPKAFIQTFHAFLVLRFLLFLPPRDADRQGRISRRGAQYVRGAMMQRTETGFTSSSKEQGKGGRISRMDHGP